MKAIAIALLSNAQKSKLVWLALGGNQITDRGAEHLAVALKLQHIIREDPLQGEGEGGSGGGRMGRRRRGGVWEGGKRLRQKGMGPSSEGGWNRREGGIGGRVE